MEKFELTFPADGEPERLDSFVARSVGALTRSAIQKLIDDGQVTVEGSLQKPSMKLKGGSGSRSTSPRRPRRRRLRRISRWKSSMRTAISWSSTSRPGWLSIRAGTSGGTLVNALLGHCGDLSGIGGTVRPGIVHRIDKETSGVPRGGQKRPCPPVPLRPVQRTYHQNGFTLLLSTDRRKGTKGR